MRTIKIEDPDKKTYEVVEGIEKDKTVVILSRPSGELIGLDFEILVNKFIKINNDATLQVGDQIIIAYSIEEEECKRETIEGICLQLRALKNAIEERVTYREFYNNRKEFS